MHTPKPSYYEDAGGYHWRVFQDAKTKKWRAIRHDSAVPRTGYHNSRRAALDSVQGHTGVVRLITNPKPFIVPEQ